MRDSERTRRNRVAGRLIWLAVSASVFLACGRESEPAQRTLNIYNWVDEIGPGTYSEFEKRTGIHVNNEALTSNRVLETKMLAGRSGFDLIVPSNNFLQHLTRAGVLQKLDKSQLPNLKNLDPEMLKRAAEFDPGNEYSIPYLWGTNGIGLELNAVTAALGGPPPHSWGLLFDPKFASRLQACGIVWMQGEWLMTNFAMLHLGLDPSSERAEDLVRVEDLLGSTRDTVRYFDNYRGDADLVSGDICIEPASAGSMLQAQAQAVVMGSTRKIVYFVPDEGGMLWIDLLAIPVDAPHLDAAYKFLNFILQPAVIAQVTNATRFANANRASLPWVKGELKQNPLIYPDPKTMARLHVDQAESEAFSRLVTRMFTRIQNRRPRAR